MSAKKCGVCGNTCRSRRAAFALKGGSLKSVLACATCQKDAVLLVSAQPAQRCACGGVAERCAKCADKAADKAKRGAADARSIAKSLRKRAAAYTDKADVDDEKREYTDGLAAGLEQAADYLEKGGW